MPELRTRPRRGFPRQAPPPRPPTTGPVITVTQRQRRLAATGAIVLGGGFGVFALLTAISPFTEAPPPEIAQHSRPTATASPLVSRSSTEGAARPGVPSATEGRRTVLAALHLPEVQRALTELRPLLERLHSDATSDVTFRERMALFTRLLDALPDSDRNSLFPMISAAAVDELFARDPRHASALLDKLLQRTRILMV